MHINTKANQISNLKVKPKADDNSGVTCKRFKNFPCFLASHCRGHMDKPQERNDPVFIL